VQVSEYRFTVSAGEGFVLPAGVSICYYPDEEKPWRYIWFGADGAFAELLRKLGFSDQAPLFRPENFEATAELLSEMILRVKGDSLSDYLYVKSVFLRLLSNIAESTEEKEHFSPPPHRAIISEVLSLIEQNYDNPSLSVDMLCGIVHVSHSYLCKIFLRETGFTMRQAIINKRLWEAKKLLSAGKGIRETAEAVGYRDMIHFAKEFKKFTGSAPGAFRRQDG